MRFRKKRQLGASQFAHLHRIRASRVHEHRRGNAERTAIGAGDLHPLHDTRCLQHAHHAPAHQPHADRLCFVQQIHAQLLTAEPSASTRMQYGDDVLVHPRKMGPNRVAFEKQVGTVGHTAKAAVRTALILRRIGH